MSRYFLEVSYRGTGFAGFQVQRNAFTVQAEVERALQVVFRDAIVLTGSSRTDAGVHALQNFFHFDTELRIEDRHVYNLNAVMHADVAVRSIRRVAPDRHCRFDALSRRYSYKVYGRKNPFLRDRAFFFPYIMDAERMQEAATVVMEYNDFKSFAKRNSQAKTSICTIFESKWVIGEEYMEYSVQANRFLRGMVRGLVGTMLQVGRGRVTVEEFRKIIEGGDSSMVDFAVPGHGLTLEKVEFKHRYFG